MLGIHSTAFKNGSGSFWTKMMSAYETYPWQDVRIRTKTSLQTTKLEKNQFTIFFKIICEGFIFAKNDRIDCSILNKTVHGSASLICPE